MSNSDDLYELVLARLTDPYTRGRIHRALAMDLVLDTWLNGEREESFTDEAEEIISRAAEDLNWQATEAGAVFPDHPMPVGYVRSVFQEFLTSTALYQAQKYKGVREVGQLEAANADAILRRFVTTERDGLTGVAGVYFTISAHEDLNAIHYYRRMKREDFLLGTLHRPWSNMMLTNQMSVYLRMGLVKTVFTGEGEMLELTTRGDETLGLLREVLEEAGEFEWRSNAQRWVIFGETDYDRVYRAVLPDADRTAREFVDSLEIPLGAKVLEIGAGTGRVTCDQGLSKKVAEAGGTLVALEPSVVLISSLRKKCLQMNMDNVGIVQGLAEALPFDDDTFDVVLSVSVLHFTKLKQAIGEMVRVTKPGGLVAASVAVETSAFHIPMVACWFRPLRHMAQELGVPLGERQGLPAGIVEEELRTAGLQEVWTVKSGGRVVAGDTHAFLQFVLKGAAFFQNILSRIPFQERWRVLQLLSQTGPEHAARTSPEEQQMYYAREYVYGSAPIAPVRETSHILSVPSATHPV